MTNSRPNYVDIPIQPFDGNPEELDIFISQITEIASANNWAEDYLMRYVIEHLKGKAHQFFVQKSEFTTFESAKQIFEELKFFFSLNP